MLASGRRLVRIDREMRGGAWPREMLTQCLGKTLGVFGTGTIGARVAALGKAIGMEVLTWSARTGDARAKEEILRSADFVTLHLRLTPEDARLPRPQRVVADEEDGVPRQHGPRRAGRA